MSDLDADLYGDLYGNDETEYSAPPDQAEVPVKEEVKDSPPVAKAATPPPSKPATTTQPSPEPPKTELNSPTVEQISQQYDISDISGYPSQPTQQIPTYQDNESSEYRELPPNRPDQNYAGAMNRPVRPSEMKEEGADSLVHVAGYGSALDASYKEPLSSVACSSSGSLPVAYDY